MNIKTNYQHAYEWAEKERVRLECRAAPVNIAGPEYPMPPNNGNIYSMFNNGRGVTLLRIDFEDRHVAYMRITNFDELKFKAYPIVKRLMQTGVKLCDLAEGRITEFYLEDDEEVMLL